jgi:electron transfer flavoprotein alpha subunit
MTAPIETERDRRARNWLSARRGEKSFALAPQGRAGFQSGVSFTMKILVLGEHDGQRLKRSTRQAVSAAGRLGDTVDLLLAGHALDDVAASARAVRGVSRVLLADAPHLAFPLAEDAAALVVALAASHGAILAAHTSFARSVLPRAAAMLNAAMLSDVLEIQGERTYLRPIHAGRLVATVRCDDPVQILSVRGSRFVAAEEDGATHAAEIAAVAAGPAFSRARRIGARQGGGPALDTARVVVSGGRALGSAARFREVLAPLAEMLGGALGATRAAVDAGHAPNDIQVGQTGVTVAPELYFAIGISGAVQHTAGMKDSKTVVAINKDSEAPIFELADYALVADLFVAVPALVEALAGGRETGDGRQETAKPIGVSIS